MTLILDHNHTATFRSRNRSAIAAWAPRAGTMLRRVAGSLARNLGKIPQSILSAAALVYVAPFTARSPGNDWSNPERY